MWVPLILFALTALVGLIWTSRHYLVSRSRRSEMTLSERYPGPPRQRPLVSILVAAKDEEENIEACLRSLRWQDYTDFEIIVCDDRSDDRTGELADQIAAVDDRIHVVHIRELPDGWCGKNNAMRQGIARARGEWICMVDADCVQNSARTLSVAMQYARDTQADLLSVLPAQRLEGFWERVVQPVCSGVMMIWFLPQKVNDPKKPNAYANGAFMLMKRSAYETVGGHEAVRDRVNEDMHLARLTKQAGLNLQVVRSEGLYTVRMYQTLGDMLRGWGRIFFGTFETARRLTVSLLAIILMGLLPYAAAILGLVLAAAGVEPVGWWKACAWAGLAAVVLQISVARRFYPLVGAPPRYAWTYALGCAVAIAALAEALSKLRPGARLVWRNTEYRS